MPKFKVMWSLRGRSVIEAPSLEEAKDVWFQKVENNEFEPEDGDSDGYEVDDVEEAD